MNSTSCSCYGISLQLIQRSKVWDVIFPRLSLALQHLLIGYTEQSMILTITWIQLQMIDHDLDMIRDNCLSPGYSLSSSS